MPKIAVVILNWNGVQLLERFLPSVIKYANNQKIYVADNASTDSSVQFIKDNFPSVEIILNASNGGYAKGYNDALQHVKEDIFCLLNSDVEVTPNWLTPILNYFNEDLNTAIVQPKILDLKKKTHFEYAGAAGGFLDSFGYPFCRGRIFDTLEEDKGQYNDNLPIFWASGACLFIRKTTFFDLGGFDEDYFAHQEEIDLCWRAQNRGLKIMYVGASTVYHLGGSTLSEMNPKKTFLNFRNSLFSIVKNTSLYKAFFIVMARLLLDGIAGLRFLTQMRFKHCLAIVKAHFSFYWNIPKTLKKRRLNNNTKKYYLIKSVVWSYFVNGNKEFNNLVKD
ncbi:glycosyltransferase family 2 protein [Cellulophaga omnivescoria]|uniref:glycosyltransferase family 2 protein n=1 Tax=Cellulophaga omnivescoria TaxID=1888890 RepID=UPI000986F850|nr:glycosyltransferase family 2 protein [Cellulophaga omnivescoria]WBU88955.1 glycosyltransferase family 2 protein [Cellulophaga omnivescoria]